MRKSRQTGVSPSYGKALRALFSLSHAPADMNVEDIVGLITSAPDLETARRAVANCVVGGSEVLDKKWQQVITAAWSQCHPNVPLLPQLPLSEDEVREVPIIRDAVEFLRELNATPARVSVEQGEPTISAEDTIRIGTAMPSWQGMPGMSVEHEAAVYPVWRLRQTLQSLGLARLYRGELRVVKTNVKRFLELPRVQQFYMLWHADVYHVNWTAFAPTWHRYIELIQGYLPLLWDMHHEVEAGMEEDSRVWIEDAADVFLPLWEQEGLLQNHHHTIVTLYRDMTVPAAMKKIIFDDLFVRYHLVEPQYDRITALLKGADAEHNFVWTSLGEKIMYAERTSDLPCGLDLLKHRE